jgi:hypothetical protein
MRPDKLLGVYLQLVNRRNNLLLLPPLHLSQIWMTYPWRRKYKSLQGILYRMNYALNPPQVLVMRMGATGV